MLLYAIGFLAQLFFSARILLQWILSERAKEVVSPSIYWILSIIASYLLCLYGWLQKDFAIVLGQVIAYYIYIWNLRQKGTWVRIPWLIRAVLVATPIIAILFAGWNSETIIQDFFRNEKVPLWLLVYGSTGQIIFTLRFVYQWVYSMKRNESILPAGFWIISLVGSSIIISYGIFRLDPVIILGQSVGFIAYTRNLIIHKKHKEAISAR